MPVTEFSTKEKYRYQCGFNSHFESEAIEGALPIGHNSPQQPPLGLYAEKLSGTAFTAPRHENKQTWLYRVLPSCAHAPFRPASNEETAAKGTAVESLHYIPNQLRWDPFSHDEAHEHDFVTGLKLVAANGDPAQKQGLGIYIYAAGRDMDPQTAYYSADGDLLIVPQEGDLDIRTELGCLLVRQMEIAVIPRGIKYNVCLVSGQPARGYALELYEGHFQLPELGPIGSNGLANARDFLAPVAHFTDDHDTQGPGPGPGPGQKQEQTQERRKYRITAKFRQNLFQTTQPHTPFDVVAWQGTYYPYKYDLGRFNTLGSISFDHPDPSIFTVLSGPPLAGTPGTSVADFVIFPPRWLVAEKTFRPPWYHRNTMSEFMGLLRGGYDAKRGGEGGFEPGGASLHNVMSGHGPDAETYERARGGELAPVKVGEGSCAFMFESGLMMGVTEWGLRRCRKVQEGYCEESWGGVVRHFGRGEAVVRSHLLGG
ncbi:hypothetical protein E4U35_008364 [Claviceps purpurea]|nr:hypothetical protein E4U35_008364 [Claviceps purpurea]KAG6304859.1 hypothetical protein E4U45_001066 [Claviceps purpurea]